MAKTKQEKKEELKKIRENLKKQTATFFVSFKGLGADNLFKLRREVKENKGLVYVAKKKLLELAFEKEKLPLKKDQLEGPVALVFGFEDEISPAKAVYKFQEEYGSPELLGGLVEGEVVSKEEALTLAKLPSVEELQAKLVRTLNNPLAGFRNSLEGNLKGLVVCLNQIKK